MTQESSTSNAAPTIDDLPSNPEDFQQWASGVSEGMDVGGSGPTPDAPASASSGAKVEDGKGATEGEVKTENAEAPKGAEVIADKPTEGTAPEGVLAKDGKTVIPYTVLANARKESQAEREARTAAEARVKELEETIEKLKAGTPTSVGRADDDDALIAEIEEQIGDAVPEVAGPLKAIVERMKAQGEEIAALREQRGAAARGDADDARGNQGKTAEEIVQDAIDANPKLLYLQNEQPELWAAAVAQDAILRDSVSGRGLSLGERFSRAVAAVEALHGTITVPAQYLPRVDPPPRDKQERTEVIAPEKPQPAERPLTLGALPGGAPPTRDDRQFSEMTTFEAAQVVERLIDKGLSPQELAQALGAGHQIG